MSCPVDRLNTNRLERRPLVPKWLMWGRSWQIWRTASLPQTWHSSSPTRPGWPTLWRTMCLTGTSLITGFFLFQHTNIIKINPRMLAMALCMTGSDLNSSSKPWEVQYRTSKIVYAEFHEQVRMQDIARQDMDLEWLSFTGRCWESTWLETYPTVWQG